MTPEEQIAVIRARAEGKTIEYQPRAIKIRWEVTTDDFDFRNFNYRIAKKPDTEMKSKPDYYPAQICFDCGHKYGRGMPEGHVCTVYIGICGICGEEKPVTEPRDFGHLKEEWKNV